MFLYSYLVVSKSCCVYLDVLCLFKSVFFNMSRWKPPIPLTDCSHEYLKDNPIPYHLLRNPFKREKSRNVSEDYEYKIWSHLGMLNDHESVLVSATDTAVPSVCPSPDKPVRTSYHVFIYFLEHIFCQICSSNIFKTRNQKRTSGMWLI